MASVPNVDDRIYSHLGHGDFTDQGRVVARQAFLETFGEVDKPAIADLEQWARQLAAEVPTTTMSRYALAVRQWSKNPGQSALLDEGIPLDAEILGWLNRKKLRDEWVKAAVLWTLEWWATAIIENWDWAPRICAAPVRDETGTWFRPEGVLWTPPNDLDPPNPACGKIDLEYHVWFNLVSHTGAAIKATLMEAIGQEIDRQIADVEFACQAAELAKTPKKRNDSRLHFRWLVRYQILGHGYSDIAKTPGEGREAIDRNSVKEVVKKTAALIGLTLRDPDPPGHPWGS